MASPRCGWSWKTTSCSATVASGYFSMHVRGRRVVSALKDSSSFSSSSSRKASLSARKSGSELNEDVKLAVPAPKSIRVKEMEVSGASVSKLIRKRGRTSLNFRSLFDRRFLWRRIWFASKKVRSIILLNVVTVVYASNIPILKEVESVMDPAAFTAIRFTVSAIPFIPFMFRAPDAQTRNAGLELGLWVSLGYLMQALGLLTSEAGRTSFISMFTVIVVPLLEGMLGATIPTYTWVGVFMSVIGVGMLESSGSPPSVGDLLNFLSAVFFGIHILRTENISRRTDKKKFLPLLGYEVCVVAFFSVLWYFTGSLFNSTQESGVSWTWAMVWESLVEFPWIPALYTGVFSTGLCLWLEMAAMRDVSATETAVVYGLEPVWGAGLAWFLLGERWGIIGWIGAALVLGGSLTVQIYGSLSPTKSSSLTSSPVIVHSKKDFPDLSKK
ncbi:hypothetical protein SAY87_020031 [Trapa incisa]|uniref:EamA domain-containing protein n=1 Tax=Trapa incisa TaxID=236973 RepID=A0AAN7K0T3_9MYRT|nr:hypothetical protein SAY87_020031 [Trapa incisa]